MMKKLMDENLVQLSFKQRFTEKLVCNELQKKKTIAMENLLEVRKGGGREFSPSKNYSLVCSLIDYREKNIIITYSRYLYELYGGTGCHMHVGEDWRHGFTVHSLVICDLYGVWLTFWDGRQRFRILSLVVYELYGSGWHIQRGWG
jgi:hypothetical protein